MVLQTVPGLPFLGNLLGFLMNSDMLRMPPNSFLHFSKMFPEAKLLRISLGIVPRAEMILVQDPALARKILQDSKSFHKGQGYSAIREVTPGHLPGLDGEDASKKRRISVKLLNRARLESMQTSIDLFAEKLADDIASSTFDKPLEMCSALQEYTLNVIFAAVLGEQVSDPDVISALRFIMKEWQHRIIEISALQHWPRQRKLEAAKNKLTTFLKGKLHGIRLSPNSCVMQDLVSLSSETLTDDEIVDIAFTILATGHENVSSLMAWTLVCIAENEKIQTNLAQEWRASDNSNTLFGETPITNQVIKETLRLYPSIPLLSRRAISREVLLDELGIEGDPQRLELVVSPFVLHRIEKIWGPNSEVFFPERWNAPNSEMNDAFVPFGGGTRACFGQQLANIELRTMLKTLFRRKVTICIKAECKPVKPILDISLKPNGGVWVFSRSAADQNNAISL
jgi:cytochrome P450